MKRFGLPLLWLVLPLLCAWLFIKGAGSVGRAQSASVEKSIRESVYRAAMTCYACEGAYPESFEYLCENYGVSVDPQDYAVYYEVFASNIMPEITVVSLK